jgi:hypothetical protein
MFNNKQLAANISRKIKFGINIPLKVFKKPNSRESVTSDLFPIRNDEIWSTEFEFLNLPGLIQGDISGKHEALMVFFDEHGNQLGQEVIEINGVGRKTIQLKEMLTLDLKNARTFAVFHKMENNSINLEESFMAERGYTGYKLNNLPVKGYVHGNLDAIAFAKNKIQKLGNYGFPKKVYRVQHLLTGPAEYDFIFTNPTKRKKVKIQSVLETQGKNIPLKPIFISSLGCDLLKVKLQSNQNARISFRSSLYLGRPVVFRKTINSMDVFHG